MKKINILLGSLLAFVTLMVALPGGSVSAAPIDSQSGLAAASVREYTTSQGAVTITFDDGYQSQYDIAYPVMNQYGFKGTLFVITGIVNSSGILNLQEIQEMHSHGWEIDSHTVTHPYLTQLSQSQLEAELANSKSWIVNNSLGGSIALAYPYGNYDGNVASTASKYYRYARTTTPGINDFSTSNVVLYNVPLWGSSSYNSLSSAEQLVSNAISQNKWAVVMAHGVTDNQSDSRLNSNDGWCTTTVFTSFLTFLKNANVPIKNFAEISANSAPVAVNDTYSVLKNTVLTVATAIGVLNNDTDADGDTLTAIKVTDPAHGTLTFNSNGSFTYTPTTSYTGSDSFTYKANDGKADSNTATVSITITASTATTFGLNSGDNTWNESANLLDVMRFQNNASTGMLTKLEVLFDDTTPNGKVRLGVYADSSGVPGSRLLDAGEVTVANGWVSISGLSLPVAQNTYYWLACDLQSANGLRYQSGSGLHCWATSTYGALPVQFTLNNSGYNDCLYVMRATVNAAPVAVNDVYNAAKNTTLTVAAATGVLSNDTDADGDTLTATKVTDPTHGTLTFNSNGSFTYTPTTGYTGSDSFTYKANDGKSDSNTATVTITVSAGNSPPVAVNDAYTTSEDTALTVAAKGILSNDTDADGDSLTAIKVTDPSHGTLTLNSNGSFTYTPSANYNGSDSFTYKANDGKVDSNTATVTITITAVNDAPVAVNDAYTTSEDTALTVAAATGVLSNDTDVDGDSLTATNVTSPAHGTLAFNSNGSFTYTPSANYNGSDSFTYKANDGKADSNTATVTITITAVNDAPVAVNDAYTTSQNTALTVTATMGVLSNDTDADGDTLTAIKVTDPAHGTLTFNSNGSFTYTPTTGYSGSDSFTYKANDGKADSNTATVTITVTAVNHAPVAVNDAYTTSEDTALTVAAKGVLSNDTDADGDTLTAIIITSPAHGTLTLNSNGSFTYTPSANYNGSDSFTYKANDGKADSNTATVTITVTAVNDAPVAVNDTYSTSQNTALTVAASTGVLSNDTDVDGDSLTAIKVTDPAHGTLTLNSNGSFTYTPTTGYTGSDSFTYKANDGKADSNIATVTITITASTATTFGLNSGDNTWNQSGNLLDVMRFQNNAVTGTLTKLEILFDDTTPNGKVRLGVYADSNGAPGSRLLDAGEVTVANGWVSISGLSLSVTQNTYYWLACNLQSANGVRYQSGQATYSHYWVSYTYGALPVQFPLHGEDYNDCEYIMRATVTGP